MLNHKKLIELKQKIVKHLYSIPSAISTTGLESNYVYTTNEPFLFATSNIIYYWSSTKPNCKKFPKCEYIWKSMRKLSTIINEYREYVKFKKNSEPTGEHFNGSGHNVVYLKEMTKEKVYSYYTFVLEAREKCILQNLTVIPSKCVEMKM